MTATTTYPGADWLARRLKLELSEPQQRCAQALWDMTRIYNLHDGGTRPWVTPTGLAFLCRSELSTYDSANLTRLVLAAHRHRVRVTLRAWAPDPECPDSREAAWLAELAEELQIESEITLDPTDETDILHLAFGWMEIRLNAREDSPDDWYSHHPSLEDLVANTGQVDP